MVSIGTLRSNKKEIPVEFLGNSKPPPGTVRYGFHDPLMLVSWTAKKNKTVLLLSTDPEAIPDVETIEKNQLNAECPPSSSKTDTRTVVVSRMIEAT